ncbi:hypothetical protein GBAR_LOCUS13944 [Geodia barretti]|uniref:Uncharacterized protein n=1 Tax=Geodia barretti TaxID=519541 RepID=A0AA35S7Z8_GEOBA|nr:hypothetical protein GBAR_LOCUS13944 [Geodia barretti]
MQNEILTHYYSQGVVAFHCEALSSLLQFGLEATAVCPSSTPGFKHWRKAV